MKGGAYKPSVEELEPHVRYTVDSYEILCRYCTDAGIISADKRREVNRSMEQRLAATEKFLTAGWLLEDDIPVCPTCLARGRGQDSTLAKVALFGGSFDPVHRGHLFIAEKAVETCGLDRVIFLPCWKSPHKRGKEISDSEDRVAMLRAATQDIPWAEVSEWEVSREEASYSWKTAQHFTGEFGEDAELFWIVGTDQWEVIEKWAEPEILADLLTFIVFPRGGTPAEREGFRMLQVEASFDASSTEVRRRVKADEPIDHLVVPEVEALIRQRKLYQR